MTTLSKTSFNNIMLAYNRYLEEKALNNDYEMENNFLKYFEEYVINWNGVCDLPEKITLINNQLFIGAIKQGGTFKAQYGSFINYNKTKLALIQLRKSKVEHLQKEISKYQLQGRIVHSDYFSLTRELHLTARPKEFMNKFIICFFPDLFTTIVNENKLKAAAKKIEVETDNSNYIQIQFKVRSKINEFLRLIGKYEETSSFGKMVVAWFLVE